MNFLCCPWLCPKQDGWPIFLYAGPNLTLFLDQVWPVRSNQIIWHPYLRWFQIEICGPMRNYIYISKFYNWITLSQLHKDQLLFKISISTIPFSQTTDFRTQTHIGLAIFQHLKTSDEKVIKSIWLVFDVSIQLVWWTGPLIRSHFTGKKMEQGTKLWSLLYYFYSYSVKHFVNDVRFPCLALRST